MGSESNKSAQHFEDLNRLVYGIDVGNGGSLLGYLENAASVEDVTEIPEINDEANDRMYRYQIGDEYSLFPKGESVTVKIKGKRLKVKITSSENDRQSVSYLWTGDKDNAQTKFLSVRLNDDDAPNYKKSFLDIDFDEKKVTFGSEKVKTTRFLTQLSSAQIGEPLGMRAFGFVLGGKKRLGFVINTGERITAINIPTSVRVNPVK
ncbi:MAG: hypothetical protein ACOYUB_01965 [Patescibacteria group bacterium]